MSGSRDFLTPDEAREVFEEMRASNDLHWASSATGCWSRAHLMCGRIYSRLNVPCGKAFIVSSRRLGRGAAQLLTPIKPEVGPHAPWPAHVAPLVQVTAEGAGEPTFTIIDPAVLRGPASLAEWSASLGDPGASVSLQPWTNYLPHEWLLTADGELALGRWETDPDISKSLREMAAIGDLIATERAR